ncbi:MAG: acetyl-CoA carboxylase, carboxyltransferase subunit beta [Planctomycetota bacterium]|nr:acetyl-CoA carboxylase, carboxyltransferase subunit beta [Planctomycetota bacterium]MDI6788211.1 acetyl-CoA carboxylase, carboxyltransferase subunit beta [Planctomycetota bacterium]
MSSGWNGLKKFVFRPEEGKTDGQWMRCDGCKSLVKKEEVKKKLQVCPECNLHFTIGAQERIAITIDKGSFEEYWADMVSEDPLHFKALSSYRQKIEEDQKSTGLKDAVVVGRGKINGIDVMFGVTDSRFIMGSMGSVVGEKITRSAEKAAQLKIPLVVVSGSGGGARMYEGCISLMQMAKTSAALARLSEESVAYISVLTDPTMAGVMASFAGLGDIIIAEPKALIGFTGPRVIAQTIGKELPPGFQTSEFLLEHGLIDKIVDRPHLKSELARILEYLI